MSYTAIVLDEVHRAALAQLVGFPAGWEMQCHHMTLHMGPHDPESDPPIGTRFELVAIESAENELVKAVSVKTDARTVNAIPHVTVAVNRAQGGKPFMSNKLTSWWNIKPITLSGTVQECK